VDGRDSGRPFFAAVHLADTRLPYSPPPPYDTLFTETKVDPVFNRFWGTERDMAERESYAASMDSVQLAVLQGLHDGEMAYLDAQIGRLLFELRSRVDMDNLMLVVVGLHGEEFLDHGGLGHGSSLYQELLSVPLIIVGPGIAQDVRTDLVSHMDIYPSLLTYAGVSVPIWLDGSDILMSDSLTADRIVPSESVVWCEYDLLALRMQDKVVIGNPRQETPLIYDLARDPEQNAGMQAGRDTRDQLYYHWSLPSRGNPARLDSVLCTPMGIRDLCYVH